MSTPLWARPPERDAPQVSLKATGPCTGQMIPPTGARTMGLLGARARGRGRGRVVDAAAAAAAPPGACARPPAAPPRAPRAARTRARGRRGAPRAASIGASWSSRLSASARLGHLEVLGGGLNSSMASWLPWVAYSRERVGPGLGVEVGVGVAVPGGVVVDEPPDGDLAHRLPQRVELGLGGGRLGLEGLDLRLELAEPGLGLGEVGRGRVGPTARGGRGRRRRHRARGATPRRGPAARRGRASARVRSSPHSGRRGYRMLRTCDETATPCSSGPSAVRFVPDVAHQRLDHVLEGGDPERAARRRRSTTATWTRACCMASSASSSEVRGAEHEHPADPAERAAAGAGPAADTVEQVLGVDEARGRRRPPRRPPAAGCARTPPPAPRPRPAWPSGGSHTTPSRGTITVVMLRSPRSSAPVSSWWATSSIRPSSRDAPSITASSSADAAVASSSRGSTPSRRDARRSTAR